MTTTIVTIITTSTATTTNDRDDNNHDNSDDLDVLGGPLLAGGAAEVGACAGCDGFRDGSQLIGDLVYMRDVAPARLGRRRGPAAAMVSTQGTLSSTTSETAATNFWPNVVPMTTNQFLQRTVTEAFFRL